MEALEWGIPKQGAEKLSPPDVVEDNFSPWHKCLKTITIEDTIRYIHYGDALTFLMVKAYFNILYSFWKTSFPRKYIFISRYLISAKSDNIFFFFLEMMPFKSKTRYSDVIVCYRRCKNIYLMNIFYRNWLNIVRLIDRPEAYIK